ncbi:hypothetical protein IEO21_03850 [Rhodonia placenta]|uniref:Uncharacterized protein n=1 Tax=Rhodonia placenta TaxID=104341 RepID=A0A8H7P5A7_9APHY|nr:hypothetical protein IEO21_03850 [Postia placenta]
MPHCQFFLLYSLGLPTGKLFDLDYFCHMQITDILLWVFSLSMLSLTIVTQYYQSSRSQGIGIVLGVGMLLLPTIFLQAHNWTNHRALVMGTILAGPSSSTRALAWAVRATTFLTLDVLYIGHAFLNDVFQLWSNSRGISSTFSFYTTAILNVDSTFGRLLLSRLADSFGKINMICTVSVVGTALQFALFRVKSEAVVIVFAILYAFFFGAGGHLHRV